MRRARIVRATLGVVLTGWIGSAGCTHNYYYGGVPVACTGNHDDRAGIVGPVRLGLRGPGAGRGRRDRGRVEPRGPFVGRRSTVVAGRRERTG